MTVPVDVQQIVGTVRTVGELFTGRKYGLDYYQREYAWEEEQVKSLIEDLAGSFLVSYDKNHSLEQVSTYPPYFLGPIITSATKGTRYLVDGQQRLTSLTLLLIHLHHLSLGIEAATPLEHLVCSKKFGKVTFNLDDDEEDRGRRPVMEAIFRREDFDPTGEAKTVRNLWGRYWNIVDLFPEELAEKDVLSYFIDWLLERVVMVEISAAHQDMALEIFETMNDRGLRITNTDMLKVYLLNGIGDLDAIKKSNTVWKQCLENLAEYDNGDSEFIKHWLRGKFAQTIRERKKGAVPGDFDQIHTAFHKWTRDNKEKIGLDKPDDYIRLVNQDFVIMSRRYRELLDASKTMVDGLEHVYYNSVNGFTLQFLPIMAAVTPDDDNEAFRLKTRLIASYLDLFVSRRMVNFMRFGYNTVAYTMFNLAKEVRDRDVVALCDILTSRVENLKESFESGRFWQFRLNMRNGSHVRYLLARMTAWVEEGSCKGNRFFEYVDRWRSDPFEVEHIWADKFDEHANEFRDEYEFGEWRNGFGALLLLPKSFNASFGAESFDKKRRRYFAQNLLAASLDPQTYERNPAFASFRQRTGLPFKAHMEFKKQDIEERHELYRQICEHVWNPDVLLRIDE